MTGSSFVRPELGKPVSFEVIHGLIGALNGDTSWQRLLNVVGVDDAAEYVVTVQNQGAGGHIQVPGLFAVNNSGVSTGALAADSLIVTNSASIGTTLGVTGATTLSSTLSAGASTLASLAVTAGATVGTTLGVTGATTLSSTLSAGASTLASVGVTGNATVGGTLGVTGATTVAAITASGAAAFDSTVTLGNAIGDAITINGTTTWVGNSQRIMAPWSTAASTATAFQTSSANSSTFIPVIPSGSGTDTWLYLWENSTFASSGALRIGKSSGLGAAVIQTLDGDPIQFFSGGARHIEIDSTGIGVFGAAPIAKPTVSGSRGGNAALASALTALANLGWITDSTSA